MNAADVIGYTYDGDMICHRHGEPEVSDPENVGAVFGDSETDAPYFCSYFVRAARFTGNPVPCGELIPERLTSDGEAYVRELVAGADMSRLADRHWAGALRDEYDYLFADDED